MPLSITKPNGAVISVPMQFEGQSIRVGVGADFLDGSLDAGPPAPAFNPATLFAASEEGIWLDPSDLATTYTDIRSNTLAGVGDPVGLILNKAYGETAAPIRSTNSDFSSDTAWTKGSGVTISGGAANATSAGLIVEQNMGLVTGRTYVMVADYTETSSLRLRVQGLEELAESASISGSGSGTVTMFFVADGPTVGIAADGATFTGTITNLVVRELPKYSAIQPVNSKRPVLRSAGDLYRLELNGTSHSMYTGAITPNADKVQVFAGVTRNSTTLEMIAELSADRFAFAGSFDLRSQSGTELRSLSRGSATPAADQNALLTGLSGVPATSVVTMLADISGDFGVVRNNGVAGTAVSGDKGTGDFLSYPLFIGSRADDDLFLDGDIHSLIVRFGSNLDAGTISGAEDYTATKAGVTL